MFSLIIAIISWQILLKSLSIPFNVAILKCRDLLHSLTFNPQDSRQVRSCTVHVKIDYFSSVYVLKCGFKITTSCCLSRPLNLPSSFNAIINAWLLSYFWTIYTFFNDSNICLWFLELPSFYYTIDAVIL